MQIHRLSVEEALCSLQSRADGLAPEEARRRLAEFGSNQVEAVRRPPALVLFLRELTHVFAIVLWLAVGLAFLAERASPGQGMATLGAAAVIFARIGADQKMRIVKALQRKGAVTHPSATHCLERRRCRLWSGCLRRRSRW